LTVGLTLVVLGVLEGGQAWAWDSPPGVAVLGGGVALLAAFVLSARRAPDPVLPLWIFGRRLLTTSSLASMGVGAILIGLSSYVPTYVQDVLGTGPLVAGFALSTLVIGWPIAASQAGRIYLRLGFRGCAAIGAMVAILGTALLLLLDRDSSVAQVGATCFVIGIGMGLVSPPTLVAAQSSVGWSERGVVTGANLFARSLGSAVGVAVFGAIANAVIGAGRHTDPALLAPAIHHVFGGVAVLAVLLAVVIVLMPRHSGPNPPRPQVARTDEPVMLET
jgi:MFS family permease